MWDALTWQGKTVVLAVVFGILVLIALVSRGGNKADSSGRLLLRETSVVQSLAAASTAIPTQSPPPPASPTAARTAVTTPTVPPAPTTPPSTATSAPATVVVPAVAPQPPTPAPTFAEDPAPTATTAPAGCTAAAAVSDTSPLVGATVTLTAHLECGGATVTGTQMSALMTSAKGQSTCSGVTGPGGDATCSIQVSGPAGATVTISACFSYKGQVLCSGTSFTPR